MFQSSPPEVPEKPPLSHLIIMDIICFLREKKKEALEETAFYIISFLTHYQF